MLAGGNRSGKTVAGGFEDTLHLTGLYPDWWEGKRFDHPTEGWSCGDTSKDVRDIGQTLLIGKPGDETAFGTGLIPKKLIKRVTTKHGLADAIESAFVTHVSGGTSTLMFKSYDQQRTAFQGTSQHFIHLDEECPIDIYTECLMRTMTVNGIVYLTATPLMGLTDLMLQFMPEMQPTPEPATTERRNG